MGAVVFFAFVLFVMGGGIAYAGDRLGSYIGKKRKSTFGLRPRHTAMLWTVMSGGGAAVITLLLLLIWDSTVKMALEHGPQLINENQMLEHQNAALTRHNLVTEQQAQADGLRAIRAQARATSAQAQADRAQGILASVSADLGKVRTSLVRSQTALQHSQTALQQRLADLTATRGQLAFTRTGLDNKRQEVARAEERVRAARRGVLQAQRQLQVASSQVVQANKSVLDLVIKQDRLHSENEKLAGLNRAQSDLLLVSHGRTVVFRRGEELGRTVVAANQPPDALRRKLAGFLDQVELTARQRGAGGSDNAPAVAVPSVGGAADDPTAAREAALDALTQNITAQAGFMPSIVVVADARFNTFHGETVKLDLRPYSNIMVFPKGTIIASDTLDGSKPEDVILKSLQLFLATRVRAVALNRGIIPIHDPQSGETLVGQPIDSTKWLSWVKQIQQDGSGARVTAFATADTYSGDLLHLDLNVVPAGGSAPAPPAASAAVPK